jgi:hypothetical protein
LFAPGLPSRFAPAVLAARSGVLEDRNGRLRSRGCFAGAKELIGPDPWTVQWSGATVREEFLLFGLETLEADEDRAAGFTRIRELLRCDPDHPFPEWHARKGEPGSPRLFLAGCRLLVDQLSSAPLEADDEPHPRSAVSRRWESSAGGLVVALRYAVLSRPSPSEPPEDARRVLAKEIGAREITRQWTFPEVEERPSVVEHGTRFTT